MPDSIECLAYIKKSCCADLSIPESFIHFVNHCWCVENNSYLFVISDNIFFSNYLAMLDKRFIDLYESGNPGLMISMISSFLSDGGQSFSL